MHVAIGSQNPVKVDACKQAFSLFFDDIQVVPASVESNVKPFPTSEAETMDGALNRAYGAAAAVPGADFAVGIEAGIITVEQHRFAQAYVMVLHEQRLGIGGSAAFEVPSNIVDLIDPTSEASKDLIDTAFGRRNIFQHEGAIGALTSGRLTRTAILRDAVICALTRFLNPQYYEERRPASRVLKRQPR